MSEIRKTRPSRPTHRPQAAVARWTRRWLAATDWLGARKPLELILGAVTFIAGVSLLVHLL